MLGLRLYGREVIPLLYTTARANSDGNDRWRKSNNRITRGTCGNQKSTSRHMKRVAYWNETAKSLDSKYRLTKNFVLRCG